MTNSKKASMKRIHLGSKMLFAALIFVCFAWFATIIVTDVDALGDPNRGKDPRITASLTQDHLEGLRVAIHRGRFVSLREIDRFGNNMPIMRIEQVTASTSSAELIVDVTVGRVCGPLCGSGYKHRLSKQAARWSLVRSEFWKS
jgi:hypothetical protein